jgi:6-phosphogluconate dehydrogenase
MEQKGCDIGLLGLGVMGRNFVLNMADHGFSVGVFNRTTSKTREFMKQDVGDRQIQAGYAMAEFVSLLKLPRAVLISVPAGKPVDQVIDEIVPELSSGDLIVDMGNSHFSDTDRRGHLLTEKGLLYMGMGISGGESGARNGPSLMPGGSKEGYERIRPIVEAASAQTDGIPCAAYLGPGSAGHYVKMVHNGIEYGLMQLIAETYDLMKRGMGYEAQKLHQVYQKWSEGDLNGYLMEITSEIFRQKDDLTGEPLVEMILDRARQKGTGEWTSLEALEHQVPLPSIHMAVTARDMSDYKKERTLAAKRLRGPHDAGPPLGEDFVDRLEGALYAGMVVCYAQGMALLDQVGRNYGYGLDLQTIATIWRGGCIIRARLLEDIREAYAAEPHLPNLLLNSRLGGAVEAKTGDLREAVCLAARSGIPAPGLMAALSYFDAYRSERLPANLIMAQRDYFGAHRYERVDREGTYHTAWTEREVEK